MCTEALRIPNVHFKFTTIDSRKLQTAKAPNNESSGGSTQTRTGPRFTLHCRRNSCTSTLKFNPQKASTPKLHFHNLKAHTKLLVFRTRTGTFSGSSIHPRLFFLRLAASETQNGSKDAREK